MPGAVSRARLEWGGSSGQPSLVREPLLPALARVRSWAGAASPAMLKSGSGGRVRVCPGRGSAGLRRCHLASEAAAGLDEWRHRFRGSLCLILALYHPPPPLDCLSACCSPPLLSPLGAVGAGKGSAASGEGRAYPPRCSPAAVLGCPGGIAAGARPVRREPSDKRAMAGSPSWELGVCTG